MPVSGENKKTDRVFPERIDRLAAFRRVNKLGESPCTDQSVVVAVGRAALARNKYCRKRDRRKQKSTVQSQRAPVIGQVQTLFL